MKEPPFPCCSDSTSDREGYATETARTARQAAFNRRSTFMKVLGVSVAATLIIYAFTLYIYNTSVSSLKDNMTQQVMSMENQFMDGLEQDAARIKNATVKAFNKPDWLVISFHQGLIRDYTFLQQVLRAKERLEAIRTISPFVYDVSAHFPVWGRSLSYLNGLRTFNGEAFANIMMPLDKTGAQFVYWKGGVYLTSAFRFSRPDNFSIVIQMDTAYIGNALRKLNTLEGSRTYLIRSDTGDIIASSAEGPAEDLAAIRSDFTSPSGAAAATIGGKRFICVHRYDRYLGMTLINLLPEAELYKPLQIYYVLIILFTAVVLLTIAAIVFYIYRVMGRPMKRLMLAFESMEKGDFGVRLVPDVQDDFAYLYRAFDHMAENTQRLISEVYEKELLVERARLKHLQAQINPHFLYNSFYTLHRMIKIGDADNAGVFSAKLGRYFQYITRDARDAVPLKTEAEHAAVYADIMAVRYGGAVDIDMGAPPAGWEDVPVPRLILQPLIENAFEHGMKQRTGRGIVRITFTAEEGALVVAVDDNGRGLEDGELDELNGRIADGRDISEITGLGNINRRVRIALGPGCGLAVSRSDLGGARVTLRLRREAEGSL